MSRSSVTWTGNGAAVSEVEDPGIDILVVHIGKLLRHPAYRRDSIVSPLLLRHLPHDSGYDWTGEATLRARLAGRRSMRRASITSSGTSRPSSCACAGPPSDTLTAAHAGTRTVARRPPSGLSCRTMSPPWARAMSRAIASPRPEPPASWRASSRPHERLEHLLPALGRDAGAVVVDRDEEGPRLQPPGDRHRLAVAGGVGREIEQAAPERAGPHGDLRRADEIRRPTRGRPGARRRCADPPAARACRWESRAPPNRRARRRDSPPASGSSRRRRGSAPRSRWSARPGRARGGTG